jgi:DNA-binding response OmpR family regulator/two-component sensor histidine kinase
MDIGEALEGAGFEAVPCGDLRAARETLQTADCSLVVLDAVLPDGSGLDFIEELKTSSTTNGIPILLLANEPDSKDEARPAFFADAYVGKPYELGPLVSRARGLVSTRGRRAPGGPRRILVIDDSLTYRSQVKEALTAIGHEVHEATTGEEGLALVAAVWPDAIVVDGVLPGIDGATVVRRLKSDTSFRTTPCLLLTAAEGAEDELRSLEAGADAYVRKSEDLEVILARLAALLRHTRDAHGEELPSLLGPKRLLAVDDSITYLAELGEQLRQEGHDVILATSGEEALTVLAARPVDCILLDLIMPGLSGQETCRRIKQAPEWRDIPLVILNARDDRDAMIEGINAGADDYIAKSADFDVLKARLRAQLRRKHFEDENRRIREKLVRREAEVSYTRALEQANRELALAKEQAEQSSRFKSSFLANMSHELRTPLNAIIGFAELLYDGQVRPDMPEHKEFLGDILTSGRHLLKLINDVLDLSKVEAGKLEFHPEQVSLAGLVGEVLAVLKTAAADKRISVEVDIHPELREVVVDPARLKQILYNYMSNALKFTPVGGRIQVRARAEGEGAFCLEVEDTGIGISADDVGRLFAEFEQLDAGAAKKHAGTGLGLALTKRLAEAQGGSVSVRSTLGAGSTFHAILPRRATKGSRLPSPRTVAGAPGAPVVLVVEDRDEDQAVIVRALSAAGYSVETAATGAQALARCQDRAYDAITLDLLLPDANGLEVLRAIRTEGMNREVPILVITVVTERGALGGGTVHDILSKPLNEAAMLESLTRAGVSPERMGTVLVVDDDPGSSKLMAAMLAQLGYEADCVLSGAEGLRVAKASPPEAVVLDLLMPEMDGLEFLEAFRLLPDCDQIPVILWTSKDLSDSEYARVGPLVLTVLQKGRDVGSTVLDEIRAVLGPTTRRGG